MSFRSPFFVWFLVSQSVALLAPGAMAIWLRQRGAKVTLADALLFSSMQRVYRQWCAEQQRSDGWIRWVQPLVLANLGAAIAANVILLLR